MQEYCIKTSSNICFGYLLESPLWGDSNKYPKHRFWGEIRIKQGLCYISFCPLRIPYNSRFILMAIFLETNAVVVMRIHCKYNELPKVLPLMIDCDRWSVTFASCDWCSERFYSRLIGKFCFRNIFFLIFIFIGKLQRNEIQSCLFGSFLICSQWKWRNLIR